MRRKRRYLGRVRIQRFVKEEIRDGITLSDGAKIVSESNTDGIQINANDVTVSSDIVAPKVKGPTNNDGIEFGDGSTVIDQRSLHTNGVASSVGMVSPYKSGVEVAEESNGSVYAHTDGTFHFYANDEWNQVGIYPSREQVTAQVTAGGNNFTMVHGGANALQRTEHDDSYFVTGYYAWSAKAGLGTDPVHFEIGLTLHASCVRACYTVGYMTGITMGSNHVLLAIQDPGQDYVKCFKVSQTTGTFSALVQSDLASGGDLIISGWLCLTQ